VIFSFEIVVSLKIARVVVVVVVLVTPTEIYYHNNNNNAMYNELRNKTREKWREESILNLHFFFL